MHSATSSSLTELLAFKCKCLSFTLIENEENVGYIKRWYTPYDLDEDVLSKSFLVSAPYTQHK